MQKILVIEDELSLRKIITEILEKDQFQVSLNKQATVHQQYQQKLEELRGQLSTYLPHKLLTVQFERKFYEQQGSGLGLVIVRQLTALYGGTLKINSAPKETTVRVTLPVQGE